MREKRKSIQELAQHIDRDLSAGVHRARARMVLCACPLAYMARLPGTH